MEVKRGDRDTSAFLRGRSSASYCLSHLNSPEQNWLKYFSKNINVFRDVNIYSINKKGESPNLNNLVIYFATT